MMGIVCHDNSGKLTTSFATPESHNYFRVYTVKLPVSGYL